MPERTASALTRWPRLLAYFVAMLGVCLYCEVIGRVWSLWLAPRGSQTRVRRANRVTRHWNVVLTELTLKLLGAQLEVRGRVPPGRFLVVSNHQSTADVAILPWALRSLNLKFVAKEQLGRYIPTVSMALRHWGSALISRDGTRQDFARMKMMARQLEYWNGSAVVFPEGTRSRNGRLLPYKAAAVRIVAKESGLPILPVAIDGTHVASDLTGFARRMAGARGTLTIGTPIPPEEWNGRVEEVVEEIRCWAERTIARGRRDGSVPPPADGTAEQDSDGIPPMFSADHVASDASTNRALRASRPLRSKKDLADHDTLCASARRVVAEQPDRPEHERHQEARRE